MVSGHLSARANAATVPLSPLTAAGLKAWLGSHPGRDAAWVKSVGFTGEPGEFCLVPDDVGGLARVLAGIDPENDLWSYAALAARLPSGPPAGRYRIDRVLDAPAANRAALGWALGTYGFTRYRKAALGFANLVVPEAADRGAVRRAVEATYLVRDLINTPAEDMGPAELAAAARALARSHKARISVIADTKLLSRNYPAIHAVGRASARAPRLIDLRWGAKGPRITLAGKGVCFDSGGLDLKSAAGMKLMKKDMGGAAHALGLAGMIMAARLPVRLRVLIPAVENSVSGNAFRPLDVIKTRKGLSVEIGNTDAEGRLVLCDALAEADREDPDIVIDFATLTGAARVALGAELPAMFCNDDRLAEALLDHGRTERDPVWRLPLYKPYRRHLKSQVADLNNISGGAHGGAITAALFLQEFLRPETPWIHLDLMGWTLSSRPGRPEGGEAMGMRAVYALIADLAGRGGWAGNTPAKRGRSR